MIQCWARPRDMSITYCCLFLLTQLLSRSKHFVQLPANEGCGQSCLPIAELPSCLSSPSPRAIMKCHLTPACPLEPLSHTAAIPKFRPPIAAIPIKYSCPLCRRLICDTAGFGESVNLGPAPHRPLLRLPLHINDLISKLVNMAGVLKRHSSPVDAVR